MRAAVGRREQAVLTHFHPLVGGLVGVPGLAQRVHHEAFSYYARLSPVLRFVTANVAMPISLTAAANLAGLERKYFSAFFHSKVGATFTEWVRVLRVCRAMELMRAHDDSISRTAFAAGFQDVRTFERAFKRYVGVSPKAYRASVRSEHEGCRELHD
jgi:transcriptional regulator GlxA family with amidase domain